MLTVKPSFNIDSNKDVSLANILLYLDYYYKNNMLTIQTVDKHLAYTYQGNFFGLLNELRIDPKYHVFVMYFNNYTTPYEFDGNKLTIAIPNITLLENLMSLMSDLS